MRRSIVLLLAAAFAALLLSCESSDDDYTDSGTVAYGNVRYSVAFHAVDGLDPNFGSAALAASPGHGCAYSLAPTGGIAADYEWLITLAYSLDGGATFTQDTVPAASVQAFLVNEYLADGAGACAATVEYQDAAGVWHGIHASAAPYRANVDVAVGVPIRAIRVRASASASGASRTCGQSSKGGALTTLPAGPSSAGGIPSGLGLRVS